MLTVRVNRLTGFEIVAEQPTTQTIQHTRAYLHLASPSAGARQHGLHVMSKHPLRQGLSTVSD
jgi:hypothetical protein